MRCKACKYTMPYEASYDEHCPSCGEDMQVTAEDWLGTPSMGLVKEIRPGQITLANIIDGAINNPAQQMVIAQGGCGVGKSLAYLIPALLTGRRVVVSTAKKSLQGQLALKDLPYLREHLHRPSAFTAIKGKGNYLCKLMLRKKKDLFEHEMSLHERLTRYLASSPSGDLDGFPGGADYPATACTATECVGKACSHATDCGYRKAKERAKIDQVVVVNHALLGFDLKFGPCRLLGEYDILIIDEAHQAEDYFRNAFSSEVASSWMKRMLSEFHKMNIVLGGVTDVEATTAWDEIFARVPQADVLPCGFFGQLGRVDAALSSMLKSIDDHVGGYWPELENVNLADEERAAEILREVDEEDRNEVLICTKLADKITDMIGSLAATKDTDSNIIRTRVDFANKRGFKVDIKPIDIGPVIGPKLKMINTVVLTSATLQSDLIEQDLGFKADVTVDEPSPFNYKANGLVYIPKGVPNPSDKGSWSDENEWVREVAREIVQLVRASAGNALVLFTSMKEMTQVIEHVEAEYEFEYPIFAQEAGRRPDEVFAEFMAADSAVLFGSKSFFEGIDVQGEKLRLVILTKLPFPIWGDPVVQAKKQQLGSKHFSQYYLPKMFVDLMQAAGRLIRAQHDRGVFAILDVRMWVGSNKKLDPQKVLISNGTWPGYGNKAFRQLPFTNVTPNFEMAQRFLKHIRGA